MANILVACGEDLREQAVQALESESHTVTVAQSGKEIVDLYGERSFEIVLFHDVFLDMDALGLLESIRAIDREALVCVISEYTSADATQVSSVQPSPDSDRKTLL